MPNSVISYDRELPEIEGRVPWLPPSAHLVKASGAAGGWEVKDGRRPSRLLLVPKLRPAVDKWRAAGYPGASEVTLRLFQYWFEEEHVLPGFPVPFRYYYGQREAIETMVWLVEIAGITDTQELIKTFATDFPKDLLTDGIRFQTTMDGKRQVLRYVPEADKDGVQELPPKDLRRYAFKMATGSGKTWVMAMAMVWSYFHKRMVAGSKMSTNFLVVAPNVIVFQRLEKDLSGSAVFHQLPLIPPEWKGQFALKVILRGEATEPDGSGNVFLTNIHQLYESRDQEWTPQNAIEALLGKKPVKDLSSAQRSMLERVKSLKDVMVLNDEAHHVHDEELAWSKSLLAIHNKLPNGIAAWLDFSATPKDADGMYFPWTICDYPLAQAVEDRIVKAPLIVTKEEDKKQPHDPDGITKDNVVEKYSYWIHAAVQRWKEHSAVYRKLGTKAVLFIMAEKSVYADAIGEYLWKTKEFGLKESEVLVIHTDSSGEVTKGDLDDARAAARDIDKSDNPYKVIVSVMMLREGWDVRNVSVVLGLRPFSAKAEILPEQVIGRGLRLMQGIGPDRTQTLEVLGTRNLLNVLRDQLEAEGVSTGNTKKDPPRPIIIEPVLEQLRYDVGIPITKPRLVHNIRKLEGLRVADLEPVFEQDDLEDVYRTKLKLEFATTETPVGEKEVHPDGLPPFHELIGSITNKVIGRARLPNKFAELYPVVSAYIADRCFGTSLDVSDKEDETEKEQADSFRVRSHLARPEIQEAIAKYLSRKIGELTIEIKAIEFERSDYKLSDTKPFSWRRDLPPLTAKRTIFNYVATYNGFERRFAQFLDQAKDVERFAALGTTEQGDSGSQFRVDYLKASGAIGFYHPDWVVVQKTKEGLVHWIIETKGRVWEGTLAKDEAMGRWCEQIAATTGEKWRYKRIDQQVFDKGKHSALAELV